MGVLEEDLRVDVLQAEPKDQNTARKVRQNAADIVVRAIIRVDEAQLRKQEQAILPRLWAKLQAIEAQKGR